MKLIAEGEIEEIPNQTCKTCKNVYQLLISDLHIGVFGRDDMPFVVWTCPRCKTNNRPSALQKFMPFVTEHQQH